MKKLFVEYRYLLSKISLVTLFFFCYIITVKAIPHSELSKPIQLMPMPSEVDYLAGHFQIEPTLDIYFEGVSELRQQFIIDRLTTHLQKIDTIPFKKFNLVEGKNLAKIVIKVTETSPEVPFLGIDESYQLIISSDEILLNSSTEFGALHGITSLVQWIAMQSSVENNADIQTVKITDRPRFPWRGLLIDSVRHFLPVDTIKRQLDGMSAAKLNVFHWHLTDDQGWRMESRLYPKLHEKASDGLYYSQAEIREIVSYASKLGIRVVPEFDIPGHASAIAVAYPELMTVKKDYRMERHWGVFEPLLDVTNAETYRFVEGIVSELATLFPDQYIHIGGDEVNPKHWKEDKPTQAFMSQEGLRDYEDLHRFFNTKVQAILKRYNKRMMGWDEIFHRDLPQNIMVQSWRGKESLNQIATSGYKGLLSTGYYIDQPQYTAYHYRNDPQGQTTETKTSDLVNSSVQDDIQAWQFQLTRLKGSAVKGVLTFYSNEATKMPLAYLKLNNNHYRKVTIDQWGENNSELSVSFSIDTWMGPTKFDLELNANKLTGEVYIGNSYYPIDGVKLQEQAPEVVTLPVLLEQHASNILGGEATLWSEMVTQDNIDLRIWPRTFAIAERLWSPKEVTDLDSMYSRLKVIDGYASNIIGLEHQAQFERGLKAQLADSQNKALLHQDLKIVSKVLEPAHYYTRHHIKYRLNEYHQQADINQLVDYLPVESNYVRKLTKQLQAYQQENREALVELLLFNRQVLNSAHRLKAGLSSHSKLLPVIEVLNDLIKVHQRMGVVLNQCHLFPKKEMVNQQEIIETLKGIRKKQREIVIASVPLSLEILSACESEK